MSIVAPRRMMNDDISNTPELSGGWGGGLSWFPPEFRSCWSRRPMLGTSSGWKCPCEDQEKWPLTGTRKPSSKTISKNGIRSPCRGWPAYCCWPGGPA